MKDYTTPEQRLNRPRKVLEKPLTVTLLIVLLGFIVILALLTGIEIII